MRRGIIVSVLLFIYCLAFPTGQLHASHIVGGDVSYTFVSFSNNNTEVTFRVRFNMYLDNFASGAEFEEQAEFGVYQRQPDGTWDFFDSRIADPQNASVIIQDDNPCLDELDDVGVQSAYYEFEVTLDVIDENYMIAYQLCCRNRSSSNIDNDVVGSVFNIIITPEAQRVGNNSPTFDRFPPIFICQNFDLDVSLAVTDVDGDEVRYSFCAPFRSGGGFAIGPEPCDLLEPPVDGCLPPFGRVTFLPPFTAGLPLLGSPAVRINASTGIISGVPNTRGQFVVGVCVEEFRNGVLLTSLTRDFQFNVVPCVQRVQVEVQSEEVITNGASEISLINICSDSTITIITSSEGTAANNFEWSINAPDGSNFFMTRDSNINELTLLLPDVGTYEGFVVLDDGTECRDTALFSVIKAGMTQANFDIENLDTCFATPIDFVDRSTTTNDAVTDWDWIIDGNIVSDEQNLNIEFQQTGIREVTLIVTDDLGCMDTISQSVDYSPLHDDFLSLTIDTVLCANDSLLINGVWLTEPGTFGEVIPFVETGCDSAGFLINLDFFPAPATFALDTAICEGETVTYFNQTFGESGTFVTNIASLQTGCDSIVATLNLEVLDIPILVAQESDIILTANQDNVLPVSIEGEFDAVVWSPPNGLSCTDCPNPTINSNEDITFNIVASNRIGCADSLTISVNFVTVPDRYFIPNILGGSDILTDDSFLYLQTIDEALNDVTYSLKVYDRWGNLQFDRSDLSINDSSSGWNSLNVQPGVYVYLFEITEFFETKLEFGNVTVFR